MQYAETDSVRPATEGHPSAAGKGGEVLAVNWGSNPQPSTRVNEQYVEQKLNELWKMRLSK